MYLMNFFKVCTLQFHNVAVHGATLIHYDLPIIYSLTCVVIFTPVTCNHLLLVFFSQVLHIIEEVLEPIITQSDAGFYNPDAFQFLNYTESINNLDFTVR